MPRTKVQRSKQKAKAAKNTNDEETAIYKKLLLEICDKEKERQTKILREKMDNFLKDNSNLNNEIRLKVPYKLLKKTVAEITSDEFEDTPTSITINSNMTTTMNVTKTLRSERTLLKRSASFIDDEGYTTAESTGPNSGGRQSRTRSKKLTQGPKSRSLSRNATQKRVPQFKTPANQQPPMSSYGTITPKCKPNTPQVILRRPKQGEVALSYQGSPLLTGPVMVDATANINIPLPDGNLMSLQPRKGLRVSQIPQVDSPTRRQLQVLRDNLIKVCTLMGET